MKKFLPVILATVIIVFTAVYIYKQSTYTYITVKFKELRPFSERVPVYYKGIVIGRATEKKHSYDFKHALVNVAIFDKNLKLPENTKVLLKKEKKCFRERDFLELQYPKEPSEKMISAGSVLEGKAMIDKDYYLANIDPDTIEEIEQNLLSSSENLDNALSELGDLFILLQDVIKENRGSLKTFSGNLAQSTGNINQITSKFDRSIKQKSLDNTMSNIDSAVAKINTSTGNLEIITGNLNGTTQSVNQAIPRIDTALYEAQSILCNVNVISSGLRKTLAKRFGGLRILFGKTIDECNSNTCRH